MLVSLIVATALFLFYTSVTVSDQKSINLTIFWMSLESSSIDVLHALNVQSKSVAYSHINNLMGFFLMPCFSYCPRWIISQLTAPLTTFFKYSSVLSFINHSIFISFITLQLRDHFTGHSPRQNIHLAKTVVNN